MRSPRSPSPASTPRSTPVRGRSGATTTSCRSRLGSSRRWYDSSQAVAWEAAGEERRMSARRSGLAVLLAALAVGAPPAVAHDHDSGAHPSLRAAVTDQNFYFVMADRFAN